MKKIRTIVIVKVMNNYKKGRLKMADINIYEQIAKKVKDTSKVTERISAVMAVINVFLLIFGIYMAFNSTKSTGYIILCIVSAIFLAFWILDIMITKESDTRTIGKIFYNKSQPKSAKIISFKDEGNNRIVVVNDGINEDDYEIKVKKLDIPEIKEMKIGNKVEVISYTKFLYMSSKTVRELIINDKVLM